METLTKCGPHPRRILLFHIHHFHLFVQWFKSWKVECPTHWLISSMIFIQNPFRCEFKTAQQLLVPNRKTKYIAIFRIHICGSEYSIIVFTAWKPHKKQPDNRVHFATTTTSAIQFEAYAFVRIPAKVAITVGTARVDYDCNGKRRNAKRV